MIIQGIIKDIHCENKFQGNEVQTKYDVHLPAFDKANNTKLFIVQAVAIKQPGVHNRYEIGDVVYVGFVNNQLKFPIILGKIDKLSEDPNICDYLGNSIKINGNANLPIDTKFINPEGLAIISVNDIVTMMHKIKNLEDRIDQLEQQSNG